MVSLETGRSGRGEGEEGEVVNEEGVETKRNVVTSES